MMPRKNLIFGILVIISTLGAAFSQQESVSQNISQPGISFHSPFANNGPYKFAAVSNYDLSSKVITTTTGNQQISVSYAPDFEISIDPNSITIQAGTTGNVNVTTLSLGYVGPVTLSATVSPAASPGPTATIDTSNIILTAHSNVVSHLTLSTSYNTTVQIYSVTISATNRYETTRTTLLNLVLTPPPPPDFSIAASPDGITIVSTDYGNSTITLGSIYGFNGDVQLYTATSDSRLTCILDQNPVTLTDTVQSGSSRLSCKGPEGNYNVTVTGQSDTLSHNALLKYKIQIFTVSADPATLTLLSSESGTSTITVKAKNDFSNVINLQTTVLPQDALSCTLSTTRIQTAGVSTLKCRGPVGTYTVQVTGTSGQVPESTNVVVTVQDFTIQSDPGSVTTKADSDATSTIAVRPLNGLTDNITLSITSISPGQGLSCTLSRTITRDASRDTILSCKGSSGAYTVLVTATLRSSSHAIKVDYSIVSNAVTRPSNVLTYWPFMIVAAVGTVVAGIILIARKRP